MKEIVTLILRNPAELLRGSMAFRNIDIGTVEKKLLVDFFTHNYFLPAGKLKTEKRMLHMKLEYLQGLQEEINATIRQVQEQLADLPSEK